MKHIKLILATLTLVIFGGLMSVYAAQPANASSYSASRENSVTVVWRKKMGKHYFVAKEGALYSRHLGTKYLDIKSKPNESWYTVAHEALKSKSTGKTSIYYNVKSTDGKYNGWIWRGYLTPRADAKVDAQYVPQDQYTALRAGILKSINASRADDNDQSLRLTKGLFNVASQRVKEVTAQGQAKEDITHTRDDGSSAAYYWAKKLNVNTHGFKGVADAVGYAPLINNDNDAQISQITRLFGKAQWKSFDKADYAMIGMSFYADTNAGRLYFALNYC